MGLIDGFHEKMVFNRRVNVLASKISELLPLNARILDVGCGNGLIDKIILNKRPDISISGIDVLVRPMTHIEVKEYDGITFPFEDNSFDVVMFMDVLHHTDDAFVVLREAKRVSKKFILIKDHARDGFLSYPTLRFMDWVGNAHHGVRLPYNYWSRSEWKNNLEKIELKIQSWNSRIGLYPWPAAWVFERNLHFIAMLTL